MKKSFKEFININDLPNSPVDIIKELQEKIVLLENKNQSLISSSGDISRLQKENDELRKENNELRKELENYKDCISVIFTTRDQDIHCSLICKKNDEFKTIEKRFYDKHSGFIETESENTFSVRNNNIDRSKTLEENGIRDSDLIILN